MIERYGRKQQWQYVGLYTVIIDFSSETGGRHVDVFKIWGSKMQWLRHLYSVPLKETHQFKSHT
jgi:hypothetical protein